MKQLTKYALITAAACAIAVIAARPAHAQSAPKTEIEAGYQYEWAKAKGESDSTNFPAGWFVDVTGMINNMWSWVGQVDGSYHKRDGGDTEKLHNVGGGVRASWRKNPKYTPFAQGLVGYSHFSGGSDSINGYNIDADGGVIIPINGKWGVKVLGGYRFFRFSGDGSDSFNVNGFRFLAGVDIPVGSK